ncbi:piRNA biogenesis protein EXD1 [Halotydeus destructor]|nr:piRNA biogenesis protein EXD1 [Halotydeus destructor]
MDNNDYEYTRNMTLLFFLDRLMDKGQPRTLHDLSCQFGTKGFTKEMRQIAGGSQSGLRKFLSKYPSLFTIVEDQVYITQLSASKDANGENKRDYTKEAVQYFVLKLQQYGNAQVPIKSLLGHRSQAPLEIRHVSGQHAKEFRDFLERFEEFVVCEEYVVLKEVLDRMEASGKSIATLSRVPEDVAVDPYLTQQLISFLESTLNSCCEDDAITIDNLFVTLKAQHAEELWSKLVNNTSDLTTLLKMNSKLFHVHANTVSLTKERKTTFQEVSPNEKGSPLKMPFPSSPTSAPGPVANGGSNESNSALPKSSPTRSPSLATLQQRMRNQIIKAISDNATTPTSRHVAASSSTSSSPCAYIDQAVVLRNTRLITKTREAEDIVDDILKKGDPVGIDCEGINLGQNGSITLVQIATMHADAKTMSSAKVYLFDVFLNPDLMTGCLKRLFESNGVVKVIHDCRNDSAALHFQYGIQMQSVFDTQVAYAVYQQQTLGKPAYKTKFVSLSTLCEIFRGGLVVNPKKDTMKKNYRRDQRFWSRRPLSEDMIFYAAADVFSLVPEIYMNMLNSIRHEYQPLLIEMNEEAILSGIKPDEVKQLRKSRKVDMEVMDLKIKLYNSEAPQIVLSNREIRLLRYIDLTDEIKSKIDGCQKVAKKLDRLSKKEEDMTNGRDNSDNESDNESDDESNTINGRSSDVEVEDYQHSSLSSNQSQDLFNGNTGSLFSPCSDSLLSSRSCCSCSCHMSGDEKGKEVRTSEAFVQTLSTGDIVITKVIFEENE